MEIKIGRTEFIKGDKAIAFGRDHAVGLFIQIWQIDPALPIDYLKNQPDGENIIVDKDEMFNELTIEEFTGLAFKHGFIGFDADMIKEVID